MNPIVNAQPNPFESNAGLADHLNDKIVKSRFEGGIHLSELKKGALLRIQTRSREYTMMYCGERNALIWGHPEICPEPVPIQIVGSTWGGSMLKSSFIGKAMHLEYQHPTLRRVVTSPIVAISTL